MLSYTSRLLGFLRYAFCAGHTYVGTAQLLMSCQCSGEFHWLRSMMLQECDPEQEGAISHGKCFAAAAHVHHGSPRRTPRQCGPGRGGLSCETGRRLYKYVEPT